MKTSSNELSISVSVCVNINKKKINTFTLNSLLRLLLPVRLCYQVEVKSAGFQSKLEACCVPSHTDELRT